MAIYFTPSSLDTIIAALEAEIAKLDGALGGVGNSRGDRQGRY